MCVSDVSLDGDLESAQVLWQALLSSAVSLVEKVRAPLPKMPNKSTAGVRKAGKRNLVLFGCCYVDVSELFSGVET